ncbi:MAG: hypothetical protein KDK53_14285, partial [Maritimibacter sp.]|nr:hypothetical protein [Maritimibacter sp.]
MSFADVALRVRDCTARLPAIHHRQDGAIGQHRRRSGSLSSGFARPGPPGRAATGPGGARALRRFGVKGAVTAAPFAPRLPSIEDLNRPADATPPPRIW